MMTVISGSLFVSGRNDSLLVPILYDSVYVTHVEYHSDYHLSVNSSYIITVRRTFTKEHGGEETQVSLSTN